MLSPLCSPIPAAQDDHPIEMNPELMSQFLKDIDTSSMNFVDRMVFDINRKTLIQRSMSQFNESNKSSVSTKSKVFERLLEDVNRRCKIKSNLQEYSMMEEKNSNNSSFKKLPRNMSEKVYERLQEDIKNRRINSQLKEVIKQQENLVDAHKDTKKIGKEQARALIQRLTCKIYLGDAKKRLELLAEKKKEQERLEEESILEIVRSRHPNRPLNPQVQERLTTEKKLIEDLYGLPGLPTSPRSRYASPVKKQFSKKQAQESGNRLMKAHSSGSRRALNDSNSPKPKIRTPQKYKHIQPRYAAASSNARSKSASNARNSSIYITEETKKNNDELKNLIRVADYALKTLLNKENIQNSLDFQAYPSRNHVPALKLPLETSDSKPMTVSSTLASFGISNSSTYQPQTTLQDFDYPTIKTPQFEKPPVRLKTPSFKYSCN